MIPEVRACFRLSGHYPTNERIERTPEPWVALSAMSTLRVGIIDFSAKLPESPKHGFWIFDDQVVLVETIAAELTLKQPQEIALYTRVFERLASVASYGSDARGIVTRVLDELSQQS